MLYLISMEEYMESLYEDIKRKPELKGISNEIVQGSLFSYCRRHNLRLSNLVNFSSSERKLIIKEIRADLRKMSGRFQSSHTIRSKLLEKGRIDELLQTHSSTKERYDNYPIIREYISSINPKSILDLGCGLNPIAIASKEVRYYAADIKEDEIYLLREFFRENNIQGKAFIYDLRKIDNSLPEADLVLLFKVFDVLESKGHKLAEKILDTIHSKDILVSFSTKTLSGKPMNHPQRGWIERLAERKGYKFGIIKIKNEIIYHLTK